MAVKERILETALRMFRMYGIKSVTMFDISRESGVSKKTVYEHFKDKEELVQEGINYVLNEHMQHFNDFHLHSANAIEELIKEMDYMEMLGKIVNPVMLYEIQKYHPDIWRGIEAFKHDCILRGITANLQRGIQEGLYRSDLNTDIIGRMRQLQLETVFDPAPYPATRYDMHEVMAELTVHFILGIATEEGRTVAAQYLQLEKESKHSI